MNLNRIIVVGRLGRDPELKALPSGIKVCNFTIATSRKFNDRDGKLQEDTEWHNVVFFDKRAETIARFVQKGSLLLVEGRLQTRSWEADGIKHYRTEIIGENFQLPPKSNKDGQADDWGSEATVPSKPAQRSVSPELPDYPEEEINPEDIPF